MANFILQSEKVRIDVDVCLKCFNDALSLLARVRTGQPVLLLLGNANGYFEVFKKDYIKAVFLPNYTSWN